MSLNWVPEKAGALKPFAPVVFLLFAMVFVSLFEPRFASLGTMIVILQDSTVLFILAAGLSFVIVIGAIDLSAASLASLTTVVSAMLLPVFGLGALVFGLFTGIVAGLFSGLVHVHLRIPSFISTLATGGVMYSVALYISGASSVPIASEDRHGITWITAKTFGIPHLIGIGALMFLVGVYVQRYTRFGRYSMAIGAGELAAIASGVRVGRQKVTAFILCGFFASVAGVVLAGRMTSGSPAVASELLLPAIAAVVVGGTAITGGTGGVARSLVGALIVTVIHIGMIFLGINVFFEQIVFGSVLIFAVAMTMDRNNILVTK